MFAFASSIIHNTKTTAHNESILLHISTSPTIDHLPNQQPKKTQKYTAYADYSVHAPTSTDDPWAIEFPPNLNYHLKAVRGVFNVFRDEECTDNLNYPYCKLEEFVQDMQVMCTMIADGPLWVSLKLIWCYFNSEIKNVSFRLISQEILLLSASQLSEL